MPRVEHAPQVESRRNGSPPQRMAGSALICDVRNEKGKAVPAVNGRLGHRPWRRKLLCRRHKRAINSMCTGAMGTGCNACPLSFNACPLLLFMSILSPCPLSFVCTPI